MHRLGATFVAIMSLRPVFDFDKGEHRTFYKNYKENPEKAKEHVASLYKGKGKIKRHSEEAKNLIFRLLNPDPR